MDEWERLAHTATAVETARAEVAAAKAAVPAIPSGWPWRVSKRGNLLTSENVIVTRPLGDKRQRRFMARAWLASVTAYYEAARDAALERVATAEAAYEAIRPAVPGSLYGTPCADVSRVTARQVANAFNADLATSQYAVATVVGDAISITMQDTVEVIPWT